MCTLEAENFKFDEEEFITYRETHAKLLLDSFFDLALRGIIVAFTFRIVFLW
jgi:hypothetical protein